eukprot:g16271.t1
MCVSDRQERMLTEAEAKELLKSEQGSADYEERLALLMSGPVVTATVSTTEAAEVTVADVIGSEDPALAREEAPESVRAK